MNFLKTIAGLALACTVANASAQSCAGHAHKGSTSLTDVASVSKELNLTAEQQEVFTKALASCEKDCSAMASNSASTDPEGLAEKKSARFGQVLTAMKEVLKPEQLKQLEAMNASGKLQALCGGGSGAKGCGAGSGKGGCCAGKAGAQAAPAKKEPKAETGSTPTIQ